jgi:hypothetical protein
MLTVGEARQRERHQSLTHRYVLQRQRRCDRNMTHRQPPHDSSRHPRFLKAVIDAVGQRLWLTAIANTPARVLAMELGSPIGAQPPMTDATSVRGGGTLEPVI